MNWQSNSFTDSTKNEEDMVLDLKKLVLLK